MTPGSPTITFRLPFELLSWVNGQAKKRKLSVSDYIRDLLEREMGITGGIDESDDNQRGHAIARIMDLHSQGVSFTKIARMLNSEGIVSSRGGDWYASTVSYVIKHSKKHLQRGSK